MVRRLMLLLAIAAVGWYAFSRLLRPKEVVIDDDDFLWPDEQGGGVKHQISETASGAVAATRRAAQAPIDRIRSIVGEHAAEAPEAGPASDTLAGAGAAASSLESDAAPADDGTASAVEEAGTVKGNINRDGEKIYHLPGDPAYERTHAERMFASAAAAEAA
ncbi:MAG: hypothetical protein AB7U18_28065, partial [Dehalococcoidia bacterium]